MKKFILVFLTATIMIAGCTKEGLDGKDGINGVNGNANVISSNTITLSNWSTDYNNGIEFEFSSIVTWESITQEIRDRGLVMVYMQADTGYFYALPITFTYDDSYSNSFNYFIEVGSITIELIGYDNYGSPNAYDLNGEFSIRIVVIPANVMASSPNIDWNNYNEVNAMLSIE